MKKYYLEDHVKRQIRREVERAVETVVAGFLKNTDDSDFYDDLIYEVKSDNLPYMKDDAIGDVEDYNETITNYYNDYIWECVDDFLATVEYHFETLRRRG